MLPFLAEHHYVKLTDFIWLRPEPPAEASLGARAW
jgi:hypothetical protein